MKKKITLKERLRATIRQRLERAKPEKSRLWESIGYFVMAFGGFILLALVSYRPESILDGNVIPESNWIGPLGIWIGSRLLGSFGVASYSLPLCLLLWGSLMVLGFARKFRSKYMMAIFLVTCIAATLFEIYPPPGVMGLVPGPVGGSFGRWFGEFLVGTVGIGGGLLFLLGAFLASLALTKNLHISKTAEVTGGLTDHLRDVISSRFESEEEKEPRASKSTTAKREVEKEEREKSSNRREKEEAEPATVELKLSWNGRRSGKLDATMFKKSKEIKSVKNAIDPEELTEKLAEFKIEGKVKNVTVGPVVTTYEFEPAAGTKVAKIMGLEDDLARLLKTSNLRILPTLPGRNTVGFEIPNEERSPVRFGDLVDDIRSREFQLPVALGVDTFGEPKIIDLAETPHLLIAGSTGSGKSVFVNTLLASLLYRHSPKDLRLILIDPKMVELSAFGGIDHLAAPVVTDTKEALPILKAVVEEMENRYQLMGEVGAKNLASFNETVKSRKKIIGFPGRWQPLPYIVVVIDEFADFMLTVGKEAEEVVTRLAQKARAAGIHLVITTQRPSVQVVTGLIKANFPSRIAFRVLAAVDSRTILDQGGAERLLGKGDLLYLSAEGMQRYHGPFLEESELNKIIRAA